MWTHHSLWKVSPQALKYTLTIRVFAIVSDRQSELRSYMFDCRCIKCRQQLQIDEFDKDADQCADALRDYAKMANDEVPAAAPAVCR